MMQSTGRPSETGWRTVPGDVRPYWRVKQAVKGRLTRQILCGTVRGLHRVSGGGREGGLMTDEAISRRQVLRAASIAGGFGVAVGAGIAVAGLRLAG